MFVGRVLFSNVTLLFESAVLDEVLVATGTDALDWLLGGGTNVAFDWLAGASNELMLLRVVAAKLEDDVDVTLKVVEAELSACETTTG